MSDSLNVDPERIRTHAGNVEKLAAPLAQALEAARAVSAPSDAFGKLCASLPPLFVDSVQEDGIAAIQAAIDAVGVDAGKLRQVADGFTTTDASNANKVKSAQSDLPGGSRSNPLIASVEDSTEWYSGVTLFETVADLNSAISSGSWIEAGVGLVATGIEVAAMVVDPLGTLAGFGVGFLIEHVQPLQDALDWVARDPDQITAYAKTWENVSAKIAETAASHKSAVGSDTEEWQGAAASAYKTRAAETADALSAAVEAASAASQAISMAGSIVAAVRMTVRDIVLDGSTPIHFNLDGLSDSEWMSAARSARNFDPRFDGHATPWELGFIQDNRASWHTTGTGAFPSATEHRFW
ncbi:WXG100 family type VII secretion target [Nocardia puris]|uniref:WXG100 family type VII secretion target n=1 Tax=Nocardia puris TaxID=208602 RepID=UPI00147496A2|nr:type VII secretion target [Nocardia puris]